MLTGYTGRLHLLVTVYRERSCKRYCWVVACNRATAEENTYWVLEYIMLILWIHLSKINLCIKGKIQKMWWRKVMPRWKYSQQILVVREWFLVSKYMHSFKVILSQMPWNMSVLISLIYTLATFLSSEEQNLIISGIRNKKQVFLYFCLFVLFSLGLSNKGGIQLLISCIMKWCCECYPLKYLQRGQEGTKAEKWLVVFAMWVPDSCFERKIY